jgi:hypothetical protein
VCEGRLPWLAVAHGGVDASAHVLGAGALRHGPVVFTDRARDPEESAGNRAWRSPDCTSICGRWNAGGRGT